MQVERLVPEGSEIFSKLTNGEYNLSGGTIRISKGYDGAGQIVKHFVISDSDALERISQFAPANPQLLTNIQSLQTGCIALQGMNLAVSIAGFAIILNRLNKISQTLNDISNKIDILIEGQTKILFHQHLVEQSKLFANLENIILALEINNSSLLGDSLGRLTESRRLYMSLCENMLQDIKKIYQDVSPFESGMKMAIGAGIAQANALSNYGHLKESCSLLDDIKTWQENMKEKLLAPIQQGNTPIWLGKLDESARNNMKRAVKEQRSIQAGLEYLSDNYQLCKEQKILPNQLPVASQGEILLIG